jgi:chloramphenicol O-acetyltransferase type A
VVRPTPVDVTTWPRREHFDHYRHRNPCSYALTTEVDVTATREALRDARLKTYPAQIWVLATVVNRHDEFRMALGPDGAPAVWPVVHPAFTVFNPDRETFARVWSPHEAEFAAFHDRTVALLEEHRRATAFFPQQDTPENVFDVSSLPWSSFTAFTLEIADHGDHLLPIFTLGRHVERGGRTLVPLALQIHHAAADGFHAARLVHEVGELFAEPDAWIRR